MNYAASRSSSPASLRHRGRLVDELQKGHRAAEILRRRLIPASPPRAGSEEPQLSDFALAEAILASFNIGLSIARSCDGLLDSDDCKVEDSSGGESASRIKDRRGCYKRRKRGQSWTTEGVAPTEDGHQWRKYGQKMILNSEFPRNYYRCTHKTDQGCQAVKQVQKVSDEPPLYKTTYSGTHTCKNPHKVPQLILPSSSPDSDSSFLLRFDGPSTPANPFFPSPPHSMAVKQEQPAAASSQAVMTMLMNDYTCLSTPVGSDHGGDVISAGAYSCSTSPHSLDSFGFFDQDHLDDLIHYDL